MHQWTCTTSLCHVIQNGMLTITILPLTYFVLSPFFSNSASASEIVSVATVSRFLVAPLLDVVITRDAMPSYWVLYFLGFWFTHIILQNLGRVSVWCSHWFPKARSLCPNTALNGLMFIWKVFAFHLDNNTANVYLYNQCGTIYPPLPHLPAAYDIWQTSTV